MTGSFVPISSYVFTEIFAHPLRDVRDLFHTRIHKDVCLRIRLHMERKSHSLDMLYCVVECLLYQLRATYLCNILMLVVPLWAQCVVARSWRASTRGPTCHEVYP